MSSSHSSVSSEYWKSDRGNISWIKWFCGLEGHDILCEIDEDYIRDSFNLYGLKLKVQSYERVFELVLSTANVDEDSEFVFLHREATVLYGLIHARYILSPPGLSMMKSKYIQEIFGTCPRVFCDSQALLPIGASEEMKASKVRGFCPKCQEVYNLRNSSADVDGAFYGPSFSHFFLCAFPSLLPIQKPGAYVPKIFGFRVRAKRSVIEKKIEKGEFGFDFAEVDEKDSVEEGAARNPHHLERLQSPSDEDR